MKHEVCGLELLHLHTTDSLLDGIGDPFEYCKKWKAHGDYFAVTDHGSMSGIPAQIKACEATNDKDDPYKHKTLKSIYGIEFYINPMQIEYENKNDLKKYIDNL